MPARRLPAPVLFPAILVLAAGAVIAATVSSRSCAPDPREHIDPCQVELEALAADQWSISNPLREESNRATLEHDLCRVLALEDEIARVAEEYARRRRDVLRRHGR